MNSARTGRALMFCLWCGLLVLGCGWGKRLNVPTAEYAEYRRARLAPTLEERAHAALIYLHRYPEGSFKPEVQSWFQTWEERMRASAWNSRARLGRYLEVLPDSPYAEMVRERIARLEAEERSRVLEDASLSREARDREQRLEAAEHARQRFQRDLLEVIRTLAHFDGYGSEEGSKALLDWFASGEAPGVCEGEHCSRAYRLEFTIPDGRQWTSRVAAFAVELTLKAKSISALEIQGFGLFDRIHESVLRRRVGQDDLQAHAEAIGTAAQFLALALDADLPLEECAREAISPTLVMRECRGRHVEAVVAEDFSSPDRVLFAPLPGR